MWSNSPTATNGSDGGWRLVSPATPRRSRPPGQRDHDGGDDPEAGERSADDPNIFVAGDVPPRVQESLWCQPLPERGLQPFQRVFALPFDAPDRLHRLRFERTAQLRRPHQLPQVRETRDAFGEDFVDPDGVLVAAAWRLWSWLSRRRVAHDVLEVQQGDVAGRLGHRLDPKLRRRLPVAKVVEPRPQVVQVGADLPVRIAGVLEVVDLRVQDFAEHPRP